MIASHDKQFWHSIRKTSLEMVHFYFELYKKHPDERYLEYAKHFGESALLAKERLSKLSTS